MGTRGLQEVDENMKEKKKRKKDEQVIQKIKKSIQNNTYSQIVDKH